MPMNQIYSLSQCQCKKQSRTQYQEESNFLKVFSYLLPIKNKIYYLCHFGVFGKRTAQKDKTIKTI